MKNIRVAIDEIEANVGSVISDIEKAIEHIDEPDIVIEYLESALTDLKEVADAVY